MKNIYSFIAALIITASAFAQAPQKMSYQAVVRDASNTLVTSQAVGMQVSILQGSATGTPVYVETQAASTNNNGLVSLEIGGGTVVSGDFATIDWSAGPYFLKTETDPAGGSAYTITGTSQLMSVPYAMHSNTTDSIIGGVIATETDPVFGVSIANTITATDTASWNNHTLDTDTQLDSAGIASLGYAAGAHTVDTDTQLDSAGVAALGFIAVSGTNGQTLHNNSGIWSANSNLSNDGTNVGIGTTTPNAKIEVADYSSQVINDTDIFIANIHGYHNNGLLVHTGYNDGVDIARFSSVSSGFTENARMVIKDNGNVGIGTTDPSTKFELESTGPVTLLVDGNTSAGSPAHASLLQLNSNDDYRGRGLLLTTDNDDAWFSGVPYTGNGYSIGRDSIADQAGYDANSLFFIQEDGDIGIGTASPARKLEIEGSSSYVGLKIDNSNASNAWSILQYTNNLFTIFQDGAGFHRLSIDSTGEVGIGTTNPSAKLDVYNGTIKVTNQGDSAVLLDLNSERNWQFRQLGTGASSSLELASIGGGNNKDFSINTLGGVGIGTSSPSESLHVIGNGIISGNVGIGTEEISDGYSLNVNGKIRALEVKVYTGWADYVFDEKYELLSLEELEQYINENHHLPGIKSAKLIEEEGLEIGEMSSKFMEKIEELTLYVIEANKRIVELEKEVNDLTNK